MASPLLSSLRNCMEQVLRETSVPVPPFATPTSNEYQLAAMIVNSAINGNSLEAANLILTILNISE